MDEYSQPDADYDAGQSDASGSRKRRRGSKGDTAGQMRRWYARNRIRRNDYMRRYMANARQARHHNE